jgi:hypothetical protein
MCRQPLNLDEGEGGIEVVVATAKLSAMKFLSATSQRYTYCTSLRVQRVIGI